MTEINKTDCRTREGCAIELVDTIINCSRILRANYDDVLDHPEVVKALNDLRDDSDVAFITSYYVTE